MKKDLVKFSIQPMNLPVAKSVLDAHGIKYFVQGTAGLLMGSGIGNYAPDFPMYIYVSENDKGKVVELLEGL